MTFEDLSKQLNTTVQTLQNIVQVLSLAFAKMEDGSSITIEPEQDSGFLVGNIIVNGEDNYLYAPPQPPTLHVYSDTEKLVGVWYHDEISENVYEITKELTNISTDSNNPTIIMPSTNNILSVKYAGIYTSDGNNYLIDGNNTIISWNNTGTNFIIYTIKDTTNYIAYRAGNGTLTSLIATYRYTKTNTPGTQEINTENNE